MRDIKKNHQLYILMFPFVFLFFIFTVLPVAASIALSFTHYNMLETPQFRGLMNYVRMFLDDEVLFIAIKNTLVFAIITGPVSYLMCFLFAWFINELKPRSRSIVTLFFYAPSLTSNVYFIWQFLFSGDRYGFINGLLIRWGILNEPIQWFVDSRFSLGIIILVQLWMSLGTSFLAFIAGFQGVDRTLYEAGAVDGIKNRWQELWYVTVPAMKSQMMFGAVMQIAIAFSVGSVSQSLAGYPSRGYVAHTVSLHIMDYGTIRYEMGYACAVAVMLFLVMLGVRKVIALLLDGT